MHVQKCEYKPLVHCLPVVSWQRSRCKGCHKNGLVHGLALCPPYVLGGHICCPQAPSEHHRSPLHVWSVLCKLQKNHPTKKGKKTPKKGQLSINFICKCVPLICPNPAFRHGDVSLVWVLLHKQQQPCHWRTNHPGSSRTLRKSQGPPVLGCAALLKEGGGRDGQQAGGKQHYLITTAASAKHQAARGKLSEMSGSDQSISSLLLFPQWQYSSMHSPIWAKPICSQHC